VSAECDAKSRLRAAGCAALCGIAALAMPLCCGPALAQSKLTARYALSLAGLAIGEDEWTVDLGKDRYASQSSGRFFGVWRVILGSDISASTHDGPGAPRAVRLHRQFLLR
jgi:hypothetical protein